MSLILHIKTLTEKQRTLLESLEYYGSYDLTCSEAATLIDELYEQQRLDYLAEQEELYNIYECFYNGQLYLY